VAMEATRDQKKSAKCLQTAANTYNWYKVDAKTWSYSNWN